MGPTGGGAIPLPGLNLGSNQPTASGSFAVPTTQPITGQQLLNNVANGTANALPQGLWQGTPIRNFLGVTPAYAAGPDVLGANTTNQPSAIGAALQQAGRQTNNTTPAGPSDSELQQLQKVAASGGLNPSQQTQYNQLMAQQQQSPSASDLQNQANAVYQPQLDYLNNLANNILPQGRNQTIANLTGAYNSQIGLLPGLQQSLINPIQQNQNLFGQQQQSALSQAAQQYQAWQNQIAGLGGGTSAGPAAQELAYEQFLRGQQDIANQNANAQLTFGGQQNQVNLFVQQKHADLDNWLNEAKTTVQNNFLNQLAQVQQQQGLTEQARQQANLDILANVRNQNASIELADRKFRQDLELFSTLANPNSVGGQFNQTGQMAAGNALINNMQNPLPQYNLTPTPQTAPNMPNFSFIGNFGANPREQTQPASIFGNLPNVTSGAFGVQGGGQGANA